VKTNKNGPSKSFQKQKGTNSGIPNVLGVKRNKKKYSKLFRNKMEQVFVQGLPSPNFCLKL
jgi:hypothetical protein